MLFKEINSHVAVYLSVDFSHQRYFIYLLFNIQIGMNCHHEIQAINVNSNTVINPGRRKGPTRRTKARRSESQGPRRLRGGRRLRRGVKRSNVLREPRGSYSYRSVTLLKKALESPACTAKRLSHCPGKAFLPRQLPMAVPCPQE